MTEHDPVIKQIAESNKTKLEEENRELRHQLYAAREKCDYWKRKYYAEKSKNSYQSYPAYPAYKQSENGGEK